MSEPRAPRSPTPARRRRIRLARPVRGVLALGAGRATGRRPRRHTPCVTPATSRPPPRPTPTPWSFRLLSVHSDPRQRSSSARTAAASTGCPPAARDRRWTSTPPRYARRQTPTVSWSCPGAEDGAPLSPRRWRSSAYARLAGDPPLRPVPPPRAGLPPGVSPGPRRHRRRGIRETTGAARSPPPPRRERRRGRDRRLARLGVLRRDPRRLLATPIGRRRRGRGGYGHPVEGYGRPFASDRGVFPPPLSLARRPARGGDGRRRGAPPRSHCAHRKSHRPRRDEHSARSFRVRRAGDSTTPRLARGSPLELSGPRARVDEARRPGGGESRGRWGRRAAEDSRWGRRRGNLTGSGTGGEAAGRARVCPSRRARRRGEARNRRLLSIHLGRPRGGDIPHQHPHRFASYYAPSKGGAPRTVSSLRRY